jgi:DNA replication protein DnaC
MTLEELFRELELKMPISEITSADRPVLTSLLEKERQYRQQFRMQRLLKLSGIRQMKTFSQFDWAFNPKIPKEEILAFAHSDWITEGANLVLMGDTGLGKTHIAKSLCYEAILKGYETRFISVFDLISKIKKAIHPSNKIEAFARVSVLCLDELGYVYHKQEDTDLIFQIISKRNELRPTIITTNLTPKEWGSIFSGAAASAILDRLSYRGKFMTVEGKPYRPTLRKK